MPFPALTDLLLTVTLVWEGFNALTACCSLARFCAGFVCYADCRFPVESDLGLEVLRLSYLYPHLATQVLFSLKGDHAP